MKLYATVSSERASKGQGGNKFLNIELRVGNRQNNFVIAEITLDDHNFIYLKNPDKSIKAVFTFIGDPNKGESKLEDITRIGERPKYKEKYKSQGGEDYSNPQVAHKIYEQGGDWHN